LANRGLALELLDELPQDDATTRTILVRAADGADCYRSPLQDRLRAYCSARDTSYSARRWAEAVMLGNAAAMGEREPLDRYLEGEKNVRRLANALSTLHVDRQRELTISVREAIARSTAPLAEVSMQRATLLALEREHAEAIAEMKGLIERWPRRHDAWVFLAAEQLLIGDDDGHSSIDKAIRMLDRWAWGDEVMALSQLLRGDRERARRHAGAARRMLLACGYTLDEHNMLRAVDAVLGGDGDAFAAARSARAIHSEPEAKLWSRLAERM
jgi:hypothetical protein